MKNRRLSLLALSLGTAMAVSCATSKMAKKDQSKEAPTAEESQPPKGVEVEEANIRGTEFQEISDLQNVLFDFDKYDLTQEARATLRNNATYLKSHPDLDILVEGHCDQRGTIQYNLALGQKRAKEVRDFYIRLGVSGRSVATISYGKERLLCNESTEECWAKNRRAETKIRARTASTHKRK